MKEVTEVADVNTDVYIIEQNTVLDTELTVQLKDRASQQVRFCPWSWCRLGRRSDRCVLENPGGQHVRCDVTGAVAEVPANSS